MHRVHDRPILTVHTLLGVGVSCDENKIVFWNNATGSIIDSVVRTDGILKGAWLCDSATRIVVLTKQMNVNSCSLYWYDLQRRMYVDSITRFLQFQNGPGTYTQLVAGCMSADATALIIATSVSGGIPNGVSVYSSFYTRCHLSSPPRLDDSVRTPLYSAKQVRMEYGESVVTCFGECGTNRNNDNQDYPRIDEGYNATSPSGRWLIGRNCVFDRSTRSYQRKLSNDGWYIVRYGPDDGTVVAVRDRQNRFEKQQRVFGILDIVHDSVLVTFDTAESVDGRFYTDPAFKQAFSMRSNGELRCWNVPPIQHSDSLRAGFGISDTIRCDSLYSLDCFVNPLPDNTTIVVDPGDGRPVSPGNWNSWPKSGDFVIKIGRATGSDTIWIHQQRLVVTTCARLSSSEDTPLFWLDQLDRRFRFFKDRRYI